MENIVKLIYEQFFLRDVIGKITPGFIFMLAICIFYKNVCSWLGLHDITLDTLNSKVLDIDFNALYYTIFLSICYILGICIHTIGEILGINSAHPTPLNILLIKSKAGKRARLLFNKRLVQWHELDKDLKEKLNPQRERFVIQKDVSGNFSVALLILSLALPWQYSLIILPVVLICWWSHVTLRTRQAYFEMHTLKLLPSENSELRQSHMTYEKEDITELIGPER